MNKASRGRVVQQLSEAIIEKIKRIDKTGREACDLREDCIKFAIGASLRSKNTTIIPEMRYCLISRKRNTRERADIFAVSGRSMFVIEVKAGGPRRTDLNSPSTVKHEVKKDIKKLCRQFNQPIAPVFALVIHYYESKAEKWEGTCNEICQMLRLRKFLLDRRTHSGKNVYYQIIVACRNA